MYTIHYSLTIKSSPQFIFECLTEQQKLAVWFAPQVIAMPIQGTVAAFAFEFDLDFKMEIVTLKENELVEWRCIDGYKEWLGSQVKFLLKETVKGEEVVLEFTHEQLKNEEKKEKTETSWITFLNKLKREAEAREC